MMLQIVIIVQTLFIVILICILLKDNGTVASLCGDAIALAKREGIFVAIRTGFSWSLGKARDIFHLDKYFGLNDEILHIAFYPTGGLGDYIVSASVLYEIRSVCNCIITVYCEKEAFGQAIYGGIDNVQLAKYTYEGFEKERFQYDIALEVEHFIHIKNWNKDRVLRLSDSLYEKLIYIEQNWDELYVNIPAQCYRERIQFERCRLKHLDRWTELRMGGAFDINDKVVPIRLLYDFLEKWKNYDTSFKRYITINYGCDAMIPGRQQLKLWSKKELEELIAIIHKEDRSIVVVQLGAHDSGILSSADEYILGESIELTKWILKGSLLHIDCEGGLVHLATQLGTKCAVIFGPTPLWMYGYEQNINIMPEQCSGCMGLHEKWAYDCLCKNGDNRCTQRIKARQVYNLIKETLE